MIAKEQLASWDEAAANVPFPVHEPAYMPAGYRQKSLVFAYPDGPPEYKMRSATLYAEYVHEDGRDLRVNQGYGVGAAAEHLVAPEQYRGTVAIGTTTVYWINGNRLWEYRGNVGYPLEVWDESSVGSFTAYWQAPQTGPLAWEIAPDGTVSYHRGGGLLGSLIYGPGLPLEELLRVAESMLSR